MVCRHNRHTLSSMSIYIDIHSYNMVLDPLNTLSFKHIPMKTTEVSGVVGKLPVNQRKTKKWF